MRFTSPGIIDMGIGVLALAVAGLCGAVALIGTAHPEREEAPQQIDYKKIYRAEFPVEL